MSMSDFNGIPRHRVPLIGIYLTDRKHQCIFSFEAHRENLSTHCNLVMSLWESEGSFRTAYYRPIWAYDLEALFKCSVLVSGFSYPNRNRRPVKRHDSLWS